MATELVKGKTLEEAIIHAALWDYSQKSGEQIEGLKKPVSDVSERESAH